MVLKAMGLGKITQGINIIEKKEIRWVAFPEPLRVIVIELLEVSLGIFLSPYGYL